MTDQPQKHRLAMLLATLIDLAANDRERQQSESLAEKLDAGELNLVVLGQFKRGKSSLVNALIGESILPTALVPLTSVITEVSYGDERFSRISFVDDHEIDVPVDQLVEYVTEDANPRNRMGVSRARVSVPSAYLRRGIRLIDTPGIGSTLAHNTAVARDFVPWADAAIFVLSIDPPIGELELEFLTEVARFTHRLLIVMNKTDLYKVEIVDEAIAFTERVVESLPFDVSIYPVSALLGLRAKRSGDARALKQSGISDLEQALANHVIALHDRLLIDVTIASARRLAADMVRQRRIALAALEEPLADIDNRLEVFRNGADLLKQERQERIWLVGKTADDIRSTVLENELTQLEQRFADLSTQFTRVAADQSTRSGTHLARELDTWIGEAIRSTEVEWLIDIEDKLSQSLSSSIRRFASEIEAEARSLQDLAGELFPVSAGIRTAIVVDAVPERFRGQFHDQPVGIELASSWVRAHVPGALGRRLIIGEAEHRLRDLADRRIGTLRYELGRGVESQLSRQRDLLERQMDDLLESVESGIVAGRSILHRGQQATERGRVRLQQELDHLADVIASLDSIETFDDGNRRWMSSSEAENETENRIGIDP